MSDEELCKALRSTLWGQGHHINIKAADRIEQLVATCEQLERERDEAYNAAWRNGIAQEAAQAKLAKAVEALRDLRDKFGLEGGIYKVLAELEGK